MIELAIKISEQVTRLLRSPSAYMLPESAREALRSAAVLLLELSRRVEKLERESDGKN
jgi:hypothetical protein